MHLPSDKEIFFRYFAAYIVEPDFEHEHAQKKHIFVHSWETHFEARTLNGTLIV